MLKGCLEKEVSTALVELHGISLPLQHAIPYTYIFGQQDSFDVTLTLQYDYFSV
jgi:hypothetical protein